MSVYTNRRRGGNGVEVALYSRSSGWLNEGPWLAQALLRLCSGLHSHKCRFA